MFELQDNRTAFSVQNGFYLKERLTDKLRLFSLRHAWICFSESSGVSGSRHQHTQSSERERTSHTKKASVNILLHCVTSSSPNQSPGLGMECTDWRRPDKALSWISVQTLIAKSRGWMVPRGQHCILQRQLSLLTSYFCFRLFSGEGTE